MATWVDIYCPPMLVSQPSYNASNVINPGAQAANLPSQVLQDMLGSLRWQIDVAGTLGVRCLKLVKVGSASAAVASGNLVYYTDVNNTLVDTRNGQSYGSFNGAAGYGIGTISAGNYGWILVCGAVTATSKGGVTHSAGDACIGCSTDLLVDKVTAGTAPTYKVIGWATAAGSGAGGTVTIYVPFLG